MSLNAGKISTYTRLADCELADEVSALAALTFGLKPESIETRLKENKDPQLAVLTIDGRVAGFKIGYQQSPKIYYSWLGAVHSEFRGRGCGRQLMEFQHNWCRDQGYEAVRTKTMNKWKEMLILNLKNGFDIMGTYVDSKGQTKILLEKNLSSLVAF